MQRLVNWTTFRSAWIICTSAVPSGEPGAAVADDPKHALDVPGVALPPPERIHDRRVRSRPRRVRRSTAQNFSLPNAPIEAILEFGSSDVPPTLDVGRPTTVLAGRGTEPSCSSPNHDNWAQRLDTERQVATATTAVKSLCIGLLLWRAVLDTLPDRRQRPLRCRSGPTCHCHPRPYPKLGLRFRWPQCAL